MIHELKPQCTLEQLVELDPESAGTGAPNNPIRDADVVMGYIGDAARPSLFYGREACKRVVTTGEAETMNILVIQLAGPETDEIEQLIAMLMVIKGEHEYEGAPLH